jgi:ComF family protein
MRSQKPFLRVVLQDFVALFFPDYCLGCSNTLVKGENMICSRCMLEIPQTNYHLSHDNPLLNRMAGRVPLTNAFGFFRFTKRGRIQHILHALKYKNEPEVGVMLGRVYGQKLKENNFFFDLIIPVPLHKTRLRKRGYNQSAKFAEGLSETLHMPYSENILFRSLRTATQTNKTKIARWENVSEVFGLSNANLIQGKHILLVDDVVTTGATLESCAALLFKNGCGRVSIASIAVA